MMQWAYVFQGAEIGRLGRPDDPYLGMPVTWVGRLGVPATPEKFSVTSFDPSNRTIVLERK